MWGSQTIQQLPSERQNWQKRDTRAFLGFKAIFETGLRILKKSTHSVSKCTHSNFRQPDCKTEAVTSTDLYG